MPPCTVSNGLWLCTREPDVFFLKWRDNGCAISWHLKVSMEEPLNLPSPRSIVGVTVVLILALGLTQLLFAYQGTEQVNAGNLCGVHQDQPCIVTVKNAGFPFRYMVDQLGTSAMGMLGSEDFLIVPFLLDFLFFALVIGGVWFLVGRKHFWAFWIPITVAAGILACFVVISAVTDHPAVRTDIVNGGITLGGFGILLAILGSLFLWNDMDWPFARTLLRLLMILALPGLVCGLYAGGLFGIILQGR